MKHIKGDLIKMALNNEFDAIIHGCNCFNTMGAGVAAAVKKHYPEAYVIDQMTVKGSQLKLGTITYSYPGAGRCIVVNAYTQYSHDASTKPLEYGALRSCFKEINDLFIGKLIRIGIPQIGCGLAGGDWEIVKKIIEQECPTLDITYVEFDQNAE